MSVAMDGEVIGLTGACRVEDAEALVAHLQAHPGRLVDISEAQHLHTAVVQVLIAFAPALTGVSPDPFVARWLAPALQSRVEGH